MKTSGQRLGTAEGELDTQGVPGNRERRLTLVIAFVCAGALLLIGWTWWSARRYRELMAEVDKAMAAGRFGMAARQLDQILAWNPHSDEAAYVLGICEQAKGRKEEADQAWARVRPGSDFSHRAILARLRLFHDNGRLADAEKVVIDAAADPRNDRTDTLILLVPIFSLIGRSDDAERLIEDRWEHLSDIDAATPEESIKLARLHIELTWKALSAENLGVYLDQAGRAAPDDDRVWLGRADLAIQTGAHDEAKKWLDACQRRRPDDVPVWRAWLNWAVATNRDDVVNEAMNRLPAAGSTPAQVHRLSARLHARRGEIEAERHELERLIEIDPADFAAADRLIQMAKQTGQTARLGELQNKKAEIKGLRDRYLKLYERTQHLRDAEEMARIAEQLGRRFEATVFLTLAISVEPERDDLRRELRRLSQASAPVGQHGQNLADVVEAEVGKRGAGP